MDLTPLMDVVRTLRSLEAVLGIRPRIIEYAPGTCGRSLWLLEAIDDGDVKGIREELGDVLFRWSSMPVWQKKWGAFTMQDVITDVSGNSSTVIPMFMVRSRSEARRSFSELGCPQSRREKERKRCP